MSGVSSDFAHFSVVSDYFPKSVNRGLRIIVHRVLYGCGANEPQRRSEMFLTILATVVAAAIAARIVEKSIEKGSK